MTNRLVQSALALAIVTTFASAQTPQGQQPPDPRNRGGGQCTRNAYNCVDAVNPIPTPNTVWLEELTWMDVRDAIKNGKTTVIIATGGMEPNGPWLATGKHNYVLQTNCEAIARKLGNALCAPLVKFVPEGQIDPPTGHMVSPGTISMRNETFKALLTDIASSLRMHGFKTIILIGDSGGNQQGQRAVADSLTTIWKGDPIIAHIQEYYDYNKVAGHMKEKIKEDSLGDGLHDDPIITLNMFKTDPRTVRYDERVKAGKATINGFSIADKKKDLELANEIVDFRATVTVDAINRSIANKGTLPAPPRPARPTP